jgi:O-acetyl-ADP-ribose deacetylase (regulator of RNase III)
VEVLGTYSLSSLACDGADGDAVTQGVLVISRGSVVDFKGDAIVNAANEDCKTSGGVDGAINKGGGAELWEARKNLRDRCQTGDAVITIGGDLKASWCIHAVGPDYNVCASLAKGDALVTSAYQASMARANLVGASTVAFSLISASTLRANQSLDKVVEAGVYGVRRGAYTELEEVHILGFTDLECETLKSVCDELFGNESATPSRSRTS